MEKVLTQFAWRSRILHWVMAVLLLTMLFIGVSMVVSLGDYHVLVAIHRPVGILILILAVVRIVNRMVTPLPPFPETMSARERVVASWSEKLLYALMIALADRRVGDAVGGAVSNRDVRERAFAADSAGECGGVRGAAACAHGAGIFAVFRFSGALECGALSHGGEAGWVDSADGAGRWRGGTRAGHAPSPKELDRLAGMTKHENQNGWPLPDGGGRGTAAQSSAQVWAGLRFAGKLCGAVDEK